LFVAALAQPCCASGSPEPPKVERGDAKPTSAPKAPPPASPPVEISTSTPPDGGRVESAPLRDIATGTRDGGPPHVSPDKVPLGLPRGPGGDR